jgi:hypothetical protein
MSNFLIFIFVLSLSSAAEAKRFTNQYIEFEIPPSWECALEGAEWICQSKREDRQKEAIIILAAKKRGAADSLDQYQAYLRKQKTFALPGGKTQISEPKYAKVTQVNNHQWIDSLHLASEIPGFYTRYLATVKEDVGVAVTLSVAKDLYTVYQPVFDKIVASMRVFRQGTTQAGQEKYKVEKEEGASVLDDANFIPDEERFNIKTVKTNTASQSNSGAANIIFYLLLFGGIAAFIIIRRRKK